MILSFSRLKQILPIVLIIVVAILISTYKDRVVSSVESSIEEKSETFVGGIINGVYDGIFGGNEDDDGNEDERDSNANENERSNEDEEMEWVVILSEDQAYAFKSEIADSPEERALGLMYREELCDECGMLFIFEEDSIDGFWMKNCKIPLDIIFVDEGGVIVDIKEDFQPCEEDPCPSYKPPVPYRYVLEVNSGVVDDQEIRIGDTVDIPGE